jgi:type II secretory pathway component PulJ
LIELVLALSLASFVLVGLYAVYDGATRVVATVDRRAGLDDLMGTVTGLLRDDLLGAYYRKWSEQPEASPLRFAVYPLAERHQTSQAEGDLVILEFAATASPLFAKSSRRDRLTRIVYALRPESEAPQRYLLVRKALPFAQMAWRNAVQQPRQEMVLADAVTAFVVTILAGGNSRLATWDSLKEERLGHSPLPETLDIRLERDAGERTVAVSTTIALPPRTLGFNREQD